MKRRSFLAESAAASCVALMKTEASWGKAPNPFVCSGPRTFAQIIGAAPVAYMVTGFRSEPIPDLAQVDSVLM